MPTPRKLRRPTIANNDVREAKKTVYVCREHQVAMVYNPEHVLWACPEPGCRMYRSPEIWNNLDKKPVVLHSQNTPELCGMVSKDGPDAPMALFLYYRDLNIVVPLPNVTSFEVRNPDKDDVWVLTDAQLPSIARTPNRKYVVEIEYSGVTVLDARQVGE